MTGRCRRKGTPRDHDRDRSATLRCSTRRDVVLEFDFSDWAARRCWQLAEVYDDERESDVTEVDVLENCLIYGLLYYEQAMSERHDHDPGVDIDTVR